MMMMMMMDMLDRLEGLGHRIKDAPVIVIDDLQASWK